MIRMWNHLYELWRSVFRRSPAPAAQEPPPDESPSNPLRDELRRLLEERSTLQATAASYQEFGYDELAGRVREELAATDRRIHALRVQLRLKPAAGGRPQ